MEPNIKEILRSIVSLTFLVLGLIAIYISGSASYDHNNGMLKLIIGLTGVFVLILGRSLQRQKSTSRFGLFIVVAFVFILGSAGNITNIV